MNSRTKVFIAEHDCASLVSMMLWLEQFPEFEVIGSASTGGAHVVKRINEVNPDIVLLDVCSSGTENLPIIRAIQATASAPAIVLKSATDLIANDSTIVNETDGTVVPSSSIKDLCDTLRRASNKRRLVLSAANMPMTLAG